jgi:putative addiction module component (TIGR02574 family)
MSSIPMGEILKLSPKKRLEMVEAIWDSLAKGPKDIPVRESHLRELRRRLSEYEAESEDTTVAWEDVRDRARQKLAG